MTRHYASPAGAYIGGFDGAEPPVGATETPAPPHGSCTWNGSAWVEDFGKLKAQILTKFRADRMQMFFVIASMISEAEINGDTVAVTALHVFRAGLKDLPAWPTVVAATDAAALTSAMSTQYKALVSALPVSQTLYFKELMG